MHNTKRNMQMLTFVIVNLIFQNGVLGQFQAEREAKTFQSENINELIESFDTDLQNQRGKSLTFGTQLLYSLLRQSPSVVYEPGNIDNMFDFLRDTYPLPGGRSEPLKEYDFVIIGAGSAGCVLANRLSEERQWSVLLLEAGGTESAATDIPAVAASLQSTNYNWGYRMEKVDGVCMGMEDQRCNWPRGKGVGGSSLINYMIYTRGKKLDWDRIANAGNSGWSYNEVLPYFLKSEKANLKGLSRSPYHNKNGLLDVQFPTYKSPLLQTFLDSGKELGYKVVDYNEPSTTGFSPVQTTTKNGRRASVAKAFLSRFKNRSNLHVLTRSHVTKINIDENSKTALSVEYVRNRVKYTVKAKKEIILSAGTLSSPQLLMLSGIGPRSHLEELDIPVIQDLMVGRTMYDHISYPGLIFLLNTTKVGLFESRDSTWMNFLKWARDGNSPFALSGGIEAIGFIKTKISEEKSNYPDIELIFLPGGIISDGKGSQTVRKGMKISDEFYHYVYDDIAERESWSIFPMLLTPKSKGYMKLKDKNPFHKPKFYLDYFSDTRDLLTMVEGIKFIIKLSETNAFKKHGSVLYKKHFPNCREYVFGTDDYWMCAVRTLATSIHHQIGTCKMGPRSDPDAVVDNKLRVYGINNLRVVDASVIPMPMTAHTNAPTIMIAEKASDLVKNAWK